MIGDCNVKVGSQEIPGVTDKTGLGIQNEARQRLSVLPIEHTHHSKHPLPITRDDTHGYHKMVNTEIRLVTLFVTEDGETSYSQQKQDLELTVAQIMNSLLQNSS